MAKSTASPEKSAAETSVSSCKHVSEVISGKSETGEPFFSFEYFPPRTKKTVNKLKNETLPSMASWFPQWMDVTWGAGGTTSDLTPEICGYIQNEMNVPCMMHLTCTNMAKEKIDIALETAQSLGIRNILALRGDPPHGQSEWKAIDTGFSCALDLVRHIRAKYDDYFGITVAGYPEGHPNVRKPITDESWDPQTNQPKYIAPQKCEDGSWVGVSPDDWTTEMNYLKSKVEAGASVVITQLFYDVQLFIDFVKSARDIGITVPILPGIMPVRNFALFKRMTGFCKTVIPETLMTGLIKANDECIDGDNTPIVKLGMEWVTGMCRKILDEKVAPGIHIYTMNTEITPAMLLVSLGMQPQKKDTVTDSSSNQVLSDTLIIDAGSSSSSSSSSTAKVIDLNARIQELELRDAVERRKTAEQKAIKQGKAIHSFASL